MNAAASPLNVARAPAAMPVAAASAPSRALGHVLVLAGAFCVAVTLVVLVLFDGWEYYRAPLATRGYLPAHRLLRPSGAVGLSLGIAGVLAMLSTLPYAVRKRWRRLSRLGTMKGWLEMHIFFGVVGPVLITLHTSLKFNGLISVGYWLMMAVWVSGFVGRYLYVRIPKTIRGVELSREEIEQQLARARNALAARPLPAAVQRELDAFDTAVTPSGAGAPGMLDLFFGELRVRIRLWMLQRHLTAAVMDVRAVREVVSLAGERAAVTRRVTHLQRTRRLFELWHVFHQPLVYAMFVIVALHVGIATYFGYARLVF